MDELMMNDAIKQLVDSLKSLSDLDENLLTEEVMAAVKESVDTQFSSGMINQSVNQIVQNLENQGLSKEDANNAMIALKDALNTLIYGEKEYVGNKKVLVDMVTKQMFDIFDMAAEKYHSYAIELPMTVEEGGQVPTYAHDSDAAADLYALETVELEPQSKGNKIRTGVKIQLPEGWLAMILPRSSIGAKTPLRLSNSVGLIDSGYRGELGILYDNIGNDPYTINAGDRIAQLLVMPSYRFKAEIVDVLADSDRGETGFGDSGK